MEPALELIWINCAVAADRVMALRLPRELVTSSEFMRMLSAQRSTRRSQRFVCTKRVHIM